MALKPSVELTQQRLLTMMRSTLYTNEFPFLRAAYDVAVAAAKRGVPEDCAPCQRKRLLSQAMMRVSPDYDEVRRQIAGLAPERKQRLKTLLQTKEIRIPGYLRVGESRRITLKF